MSRIILIFLVALATGLSLGQTAAEAQTPAAPSASNPAPQPPAVQQLPGNAMPEIAPDAAIITIHGLCSQGADPSKPDACVTRVTKAQFEEIIRTINTTGQMYSPGALKGIAERYAEYLLLGDAAVKAGVDQDPRFLETMRVARLRNLADAYRQSLEEKAKNPPLEEVRAYYNQNLAKYQQLRISRIFLSSANPKDMKQGREEYRKKVQQLAGEIRARAVDGEEMDKLQKEAYNTLGLGVTPATSDLGFKRRGSLPPSVEQQADSLKAGEVSKVLEEPAGFTIIKVVNKGPISLDAVRGEIVHELAKDKLNAALKAVLGAAKTDFNEQYFKNTPSRPPLIPGARPSRNVPLTSPGGVTGAAPGAAGGSMTAPTQGVTPAPQTAAPPK